MTASQPQVSLRPQKTLRRWGAGLAVAVATASLTLITPVLPASATSCGFSVTSGGVTIVTFSNTVACAWTVPTGVTTADVLVVAGGGGAAYNPVAGTQSMGAGGAGGLIYAAAASSTAYALTPAATVSVTVGTGGAAGASGFSGANGTSSIFGSLTAIGGGGGGRYAAGAAGGSGGGGGNNDAGDELDRAGGAGTAGQGFAGGGSFGVTHGGSGGGAGGVGAVGNATPGGAAPGIGRSIAITGTAVTYAVGGAAKPAFDYTAMTPAAAYPNIGGGGRSAGGAAGVGDNGRDGTVIVRYTAPAPVTPDTPGAPTAVAGDAAATVTITPAGTGSAPVTYTVTAVEDPTKSCIVTAPATSCVVSGLANGTSYTFTSTATNTAGTSGPSPASAPGATPVLTVPGVPGTPTAVAGNGQATITIVAPGSGGAVATYTVRVVGDPTKFCTITPSATSCTVSGLSNGTAYTFESLATNTAGSSTYSAPSTAVTPIAPVAPPAPPSGPVNVSATAGTASVTASWASVIGATGYTVTAHPGPSTCTTTTATTCVLGAVAGTTYTVTVVAHSGAGDSPVSAASNSVTPSEPVVPTEPPAAVPITLTTDKGQIGLAAPGQDITVIGTGFAPFSTATVIIYSTPITLGSVTTDAVGSFSTPVTVPAGLDPGAHTFLATGVDPTGGTRLMALPVTVAPTDPGDNGGNGTGTLPIPTGGSITLLDGAGLAVSTVTVPEGTYTLDAVTGIITFAPIPGFTGTATAVTYRITDAIGTVVTGTYAAVIASPTPPLVGTASVKLRAQIISSVGTHGSVRVPCSLTRGILAKCTITVTAVIKGRRVVVGSGVVTTTSKQNLRKVTVTVRLTALGRSLAARPGGVRLTFTAVVHQRSHTGTATAHHTTTVLAATLALPRSIHFSTDSATVGKSDTSYLEAVRGKLKAAKTITCVGHADSRGTSKAALTLGLRRAEAACAIIAKGLHASVHIASKGDKAPTGKNNTEAGRARNRRVDITVHN